MDGTAGVGRAGLQRYVVPRYGSWAYLLGHREHSRNLEQRSDRSGFILY